MQNRSRYRVTQVQCIFNSGSAHNQNGQSQCRNSHQKSADLHFFRVGTKNRFQNLSTPVFTQKNNQQQECKEDISFGPLCHKNQETVQQQIYPVFADRFCNQNCSKHDAGTDVESRMGKDKLKRRHDANFTGIETQICKTAYHHSKQRHYQNPAADLCHVCQNFSLFLL